MMFAYPTLHSLPKYRLRKQRPEPSTVKGLLDLVLRLLELRGELNSRSRIVTPPDLELLPPTGIETRPFDPFYQTV